MTALQDSKRPKNPTMGQAIAQTLAGRASTDAEYPAWRYVAGLTQATLAIRGRQLYMTAKTSAEHQAMIDMICPDLWEG